MDEFIGTITKVLDKDLYTIEVDVPGYGTNLPAFPRRGEVDEPMVGDVVILKQLDPVYKSYYLYSKLKENSFIGIRARGKKLQMNQNEVILGIFDPGAEYCDKQASDSTPAHTSWIKVDSGGNIDIEMEGSGHMHITSDHNVEIGGNLKVEVSGNTDIKVSGNAKIDVSGNTEIKSPNIKVDGGQVEITGGVLKTKGTAAPDMQGPYCAIKNCIFSNAPHSSSIVSRT